MAKDKEKSEEYPFDMTAWHVEKSKSVLTCVAWAVERLRAAEVPAHVQEELFRYLYGAVHDGTKLLAVAMDAKWDRKDADDVWNVGSKGVERLAARYRGTEGQTDPQAIAADVIRQIEEHLSGPPRGAGRTLIFALLRHDVLHPILKASLLRLNDEHRNGEITWEKYVEESRRVIEFRRPQFWREDFR